MAEHTQTQQGTDATLPVPGLVEPKAGELEISHHGSFLKADERRISYQRIARNRGEFRDYTVRLDPEKDGGYVVVEIP